MVFLAVNTNMARHLPRRLYVPSPESIKKWKLATEKKKEHSIATTLMARNDRRIAMRHRKKQMAVHRQMRKSRKLQKLKAMGKENRKEKLLKKKMNKCWFVGNTGCGCLGEDVKQTTVVVASSSLTDVEVTAALQAFSHDHCYCDPRPPSPAPSLSPLICVEEDSLQDLLDTCEVDVDFLQEAQHTHHVLIDDVINHCDVPPDEMFMDIEVEENSALNPLPIPRCLCCRAYSRSAPVRGIFTSAGSTETRLSTCAFSGSMSRTPLASPMMVVSPSVDSLRSWMPCVSSCPFVSASSGVQNFGSQPNIAPSILDKLTPSSDSGKCDDDLVRKVLEALLAKVGPDDVVWKSSHYGLRSSASSEEAMTVRELLDKASLQQRCSTPVRNKNCEENDSVTSLHQGVMPFAHVDTTAHTDSNMAQSEKFLTRTCTGMTQHGSSDRRSGGCSVSSASPSVSPCPLFDSPPPSPVQPEASTVPSPCRKRRQARGSESSGKRRKSASQDLTLTLPSSSADFSEASGFQDIPIPPSLSPSWDLPMFHSPAPPLSPFSDSGIMLSDDDSVVTLRKKADESDDDRVASTRPRGVSPSADDKKVIPLKFKLNPGDPTLKSGDGTTGTCLENYLEVFHKALPLSPLNNTLNRCV